MADDATNAGWPNRLRIATRDQEAVGYWTEKLGVSRERLEAAVDAVGDSPEAVRDYLKRHSPL